MKIEKISLIGFRGIKQMTLTFESQLTVLIGINGSGKSSILDALAILLSWVTARVHRQNATGRFITESNINNDFSASFIDISLTHSKTHYYWSMLRQRKGIRDSSKTTIDRASKLEGASKIAQHLQNLFAESSGKGSIPVLAYYPVNRAVVDIPLRIRKKHSFDILDAYEDALTSAANFRTFFEWFRDREDYENELYRDDPKFEDIQLTVVRQAIFQFTGFEKAQVRRHPLRMEVLKNGKHFDIRQFSDGEKCLFAMIGDLARRLAIANPGLPNPLHGKGVVLIDEIDLHLHPKWQRSVIRNLGQVFPHCQFIVSTHSPQVISEVDAPNIRCFYEDPNNGLQCFIPTQSKGLTTNSILEELMDAQSRNEEVAKELQMIFLLIEQDKLAAAKEKIKKLDSKLNGSIPDLVEASSYIQMLESELIAGDEP